MAKRVFEAPGEYPEVNGNMPKSLIESAARNGLGSAAEVQRRIFKWAQGERQQAFGGVYFRYMPINSEVVRVATDEAWRRRRTMQRNPRDGR